MLKYITVRRTSGTNTSQKATGKVRRSIGSPKNFKKPSKKCLTIRFYSAIIDYADLRGCWNRQTGKLEVLVSVLACGFKSHFPHQCKGHSIFECPLFLYLGKSAKHYHRKKPHWNRTKSLILWKRNLFRSQTGKPQAVSYTHLTLPTT